MKVELNNANLQLVDNVRETLNKRGLKELDVNLLINEALAEVPEKFWQDKIDEMTPLLWKFEEALKDPEKEKSLRQLLQKSVKKSATKKLTTMKSQEELEV